MLDSYIIEKIDFANKKFYINYSSSAFKGKKEHFIELECDSDSVNVEEILEYLNDEIKNKIEFQKNKYDQIVSFLKEKEGKSITFSFKQQNDNDIQESADIEIDVVYYEEPSGLVFLKPFCSKFKKSKDYYKVLSFNIDDLITFSNEKIENLIYKKCESSILEYLEMEKNMENSIFDEKKILNVEDNKDLGYEINFLI